MSTVHTVEILADPADQPELARKLLDAADDPQVVKTISGGFLVPAAVAEAAGLGEAAPAEKSVRKASRPAGNDK